jgi:large-conductance mechanosensitive channel
MDAKTFLGGSPMGVFVRLVVLSLVVGVILSALGITPQNFFFEINVLLQRIVDLGFGAFQSVIEYLLLGAMVVVPIWLVVRLAKTAQRSGSTPPSKDV